MEDGSAYTVAYEALCTLENRFIKPIRESLMCELSDCVKVMNPYAADDSIHKEVDKLLKPYDKCLENIGKIKGQLLIKEKERCDLKSRIHRLDDYMSDTGSESNKDADSDQSPEGEPEESSENSCLFLDDDHTSEEPLPDGIHASSADMAKKEEGI